MRVLEAVPPEVERQRAWVKIKELIAARGDPGAVATAVRERLNAHYDSDELKESWIALIEAEPIALIRIICLVPYLANGKTDPIRLRPRLLHVGVSARALLPPYEGLFLVL